MNFAVNLPLFCIIAALVSSVVSLILSGKAASRLTVALAAAVAAASIPVLILGINSGQTTIFTMGHYAHPWGNEIRFGILEPLLCAIFSLVLLCCVTGGWRELSRDVAADRQNFYFAMIDLILAALLCLVYTNDVFTGYVFIEICTIASCGILMIRQVGRTTLASVRYMIFSLVGSGLFLLGVIFLYSVTGHLLMPNLKQTIAELWQSGEHHTALVTSICLITIGLGIKSGMFPFHFWMPDTYGFSTPCSAGILSGLVSKGYIFLLIKIICNGFGADVFYATGVQNLLYWFGVAGMVVGSISAMRVNDIFHMVAFSSAAQIGYIYMGIGLSPTLGVQAALYHMLTHALTKPALFLASSRIVETAGGSRRFRDLQGCAHRNHTAGLCFSLGAFSMIGIPMTMGFISKYLFALAGFRGGGLVVPTLLALAVSTVLNTFYFARTVIRIYIKRGEPDGKRWTVRTQPSYAIAGGVLAGANVLLGVFAQPLISLLAKGLELLFQ